MIQEILVELRTGKAAALIAAERRLPYNTCFDAVEVRGTWHPGPGDIPRRVVTILARKGDMLYIDSFLERDPYTVQRLALEARGIEREGGTDVLHAR